MPLISFITYLQFWIKPVLAYMFDKLGPSSHSTVSRCCKQTRFPKVNDTWILVGWNQSKILTNKFIGQYLSHLTERGKIHMVVLLNCLFRNLGFTGICNRKIMSGQTKISSFFSSVAPPRKRSTVDSDQVEYVNFVWQKRLYVLCTCTLYRLGTRPTRGPLIWGIITYFISNIC